MKTILELQELTAGFDQNGEWVNALTSVSFKLGENEILGIVGETGSGKSVLARAIMGLLPANSDSLQLTQKLCSIRWNESVTRLLESCENIAESPGEMPNRRRSIFWPRSEFKILRNEPNPIRISSPEVWLNAW